MIEIMTRYKYQPRLLELSTLASVTYGTATCSPAVPNVSLTVDESTAIACI